MSQPFSNWKYYRIDFYQSTFEPQPCGYTVSSPVIMTTVYGGEPASAIKFLDNYDARAKLDELIAQAGADGWELVSRNVAPREETYMSKKPESADA